MSIHSASPIIRRKSRKIWVGNVPVGGDAPIAVQSMTNTETCDVAATVAQIRRLEDAGADIVRVSVPDMDAAEAFGKIKQQVNVPLVADIHFDYRIALRVAELGVDCLRINPGNIGREDRVKAVVDAARERNIPIRIGVNAGSLEKDLQKKYGEPTPEALLESAMRHVDHLDKLDFQNFKVSVKASDVFMAVAAYRLLARQIEQPLHLGITEAGGLRSGTVKSAVGLGMLLAEGIGDTIRISLAADPVEEIKVGFDILKSLHLRSRGINFIACPSCSRQNFDVVKTMNELEGRLEDLLVPMDVAVIGCVVNGPGEAKEAHVGLTGGTPNLVYIDGKPSQKLTNDNLVDELERLIRQKAAEGRSRCEPDRPRLTRLRTLREQVPASHSWHERHPAGADSGLALSGTHLRRPAGRLRLQRDPPAHPRVHRTLRPRHRRRHRRGRQGDVHLPRPQRRIPDHASGRYRRLRARRAGARPERRWSSAEALVHRADVPLRETAERSLPAVPPDRRGSLQPARSGHRRRVDHPHLAPVAEARHGRRGDPAAQHPRFQRGPRTLSRGPGGLSAGALRATRRRQPAAHDHQSAANPRQQGGSTQALLVGAPTLHDYLDEESIAHFEGLKARLDAVGLRYEINQKLVRGLDYYCRTAFEWVTDKLGAQGTVCGGGRYDGLVSQFGGKPTPGVGFAMGVERLVLLLETLG